MRCMFTHAPVQTIPRDRMAATGRLMFLKKEATYAGQCFAKAGFVGAPIIAGIDAGGGKHIGDAQYTAESSGPGEAVSAKAKSKASGGAQSVSSKAKPR